MVLFGQIVVGPPGCGKTTYCMGMQMFVEAVGRNCRVVNLDFANDNLPYTAAIDVRELVSLEVRNNPQNILHLCSSQLFSIHSFSDSLSTCVSLRFPIIWSLSVCLCVCLLVCLSLCLPVCLCVCPSVYVSVSLPVCQSVCLPALLSFCLLVWISVCISSILSVRLSVCLYCLYVYFSVTMPICLSAL